MKVAIMQPYFLPYIGYFQLMDSVDIFVVYDNIEFTKKGWLTRNRMLLNGEPFTFSIPVKKGSDHALVKDREVSDTIAVDGEKLLRRIEAAYSKAPFFVPTYELLESIIRYEKKNLFDYILHSIEEILRFLDIRTVLRVASDIPADHSLRSVDRVLAICKELGSDHYINPPGGKALYDRQMFMEHGVRLSFLQPRLDPYPQFSFPFIPGLSIVDVLMFNDAEQVKNMLKNHGLE